MGPKHRFCADVYIDLFTEIESINNYLHVTVLMRDCNEEPKLVNLK